MHIIFLLSSIFSLLFSFSNLYNFVNDFTIKETKKSYILTLKGQHYIKYKQEGFKFFIPYFTKEFNLKILRYNSTGYINLLLSKNLQFSNIVNSNNFSYYITDFKKNGKELILLLNNKTIPYLKRTSISLEMYNIPTKVSKKLNKFFYFKRIPIKNNTLEYILYSGYIILDKKEIKKLYPKDSINLFLKNIYNIKLKSKTKHKTENKTKKIKITKQKQLLPYKLILIPILHMKEFGYELEDINYTTNYKNIISNISNDISNLKKELLKKIDKTFLINPKEKLSDVLNKFDNINIKINNQQLKITTPPCIFHKEIINKKCFNNKRYFHNYIYFSLKENSLISRYIILKYADYKTLNDIGKYYFEKGEFQEALFYLKKAYNKNPKNNIINHNLGILFASKSPLSNLKKAISYFKNSNLDEDYYNLGIFYYIGAGVKEDDKLARKFFKQSNISFAKFNYEIMKKFKIGEK